MCRFLVVNSKNPLDISLYLEDFSRMCRNSERWQGDGWGLAWLEEGIWRQEKFLSPIWQSAGDFSGLPESRIFFVHARGASFKKHKNDLDFNQPYVKEKSVFVFNGFLNNVKLPYQVPGAIGSEKIFNLLLKNKNLSAEAAALKARQELERHCDLIEGLNFVFARGLEATAVCRYLENPDYYALRHYQDEEKEIVSSYDFGDLSFKKIDNGGFLNLRNFN